MAAPTDAQLQEWKHRHPQRNGTLRRSGRWQRQPGYRPRGPSAGLYLWFSPSATPGCFAYGETQCELMQSKGRNHAYCYPHRWRSCAESLLGSTNPTDSWVDDRHLGILPTPCLCCLLRHIPREGSGRGGCNGCRGRDRGSMGTCSASSRFPTIYPLSPLFPPVCSCFPCAVGGTRLR